MISIRHESSEICYDCILSPPIRQPQQYCKNRETGQNETPSYRNALLRFTESSTSRTLRRSTGRTMTRLGGSKSSCDGRAYPRLNAARSFVIMRKRSVFSASNEISNLKNSDVGLRRILRPLRGRSISSVVPDTRREALLKWSASPQSVGDMAGGNRIKEFGSLRGEQTNFWSAYPQPALTVHVDVALLYGVRIQLDRTKSQSASTSSPPGRKPATNHTGSEIMTPNRIAAKDPRPSQICHSPCVYHITKSFDLYFSSILRHTLHMTDSHASP